MEIRPEWNYKYSRQRYGQIDVVAALPIRLCCAPTTCYQFLVSFFFSLFFFVCSPSKSCAQKRRRKKVGVLGGAVVACNFHFDIKTTLGRVAADGFLRFVAPFFLVLFGRPLHLAVGFRNESWEKCARPKPRLGSARHGRCISAGLARRTGAVFLFRARRSSRNEHCFTVSINYDWRGVIDDEVMNI